MAIKPNIAALRKIRDQSDEYRRRARDVAPRGGSIPLGTDYVRYEAISDCLSTFLLSIHAGKSIEHSATDAKNCGRLWADNHNRRWANDYQFHIWEGFADTAIDSAARQYRNSMATRILINPSEPRIWSLRFESEPAELFSALTFQDALLAWWGGFDADGNCMLFDIPIELSACLGAVSIWLRLPVAGADDWFQVEITDITEEYNGLQSGEWIAAELPPVIRTQAEREERKKAKEQQRLLQQLHNLQSQLGKIKD